MSLNVPTSDPAPIRQWFLALTKPGGERVATENLLRQGYSVYHPRLSKARGPAALARGGRIVSLFPRYVFVQVERLNQSLRPIYSTLGVVDIVRFGTTPAVVPDRVVAELVRREDPVTGLHFIENAELVPGAPVEVVAGAFAGLDGIFQRIASDERIVVLLRILGQDAQVQICPRLIAARSAA